MFNQSLAVIDTLPQKKRLDMYFTGTSHSPFAISNQDFYDDEFAYKLESLSGKEDILFFNNHKKYIQSILFVDDAIRDFFDEYKKRVEYENTIFVITGDHPMSEIPPANALKKYHVPLIFYSPGLISPQKFSSVVSHLDICETLLLFLADYGVNISAITSGLGAPLNTVPDDCKAKIAFMNDNREIVDYYADGYFLSDDRLYRVGPNFSLVDENNNEIHEKLCSQLDAFKRTSWEVSLNDRIIPESLYYEVLNYKQIYGQTDTIKHKQFESEYFTLLKTTIGNEKEVFYDLSFDVSVDDLFSIVVQISNANDSTLFWDDIHIDQYDGKYKGHIKLAHIETADSVVRFNSYFWNKNKIQFKYGSMKIALYGK